MPGAPDGRRTRTPRPRAARSPGSGTSNQRCGRSSQLDATPVCRSRRTSESLLGRPHAEAESPCSLPHPARVRARPGVLDQDRVEPRDDDPVLRVERHVRVHAPADTRCPPSPRDRLDTSLRIQPAVVPRPPAPRRRARPHERRRARQLVEGRGERRRRPVARIHPEAHGRTWSTGTPTAAVKHAAEKGLRPLRPGRSTARPSRRRIAATPAGCAPRAPRASASRTGSSSTRSSTSWKKPAHDQPLRLGAREAARHQVEELLAVDLAERRAVGAAHVVGEDLEAGDRVRVGGLREQEVAVLLVRVRLLRALLDADHPAPDRARRVAERALEGEVGRRVRRHVLLERVVVEVLRPVGEVGARHARGRARPGEVVLDPHLALRGAEARRRPSRARRRARRGRGARRSATCPARGSARRRTRPSRPAARRSRPRRSSTTRARATAEAYSSITAKRLSGSATISSRQKSEPPSTAFAIRT